MLPLLRIIPIGGVFFAIMIVVLALNPPGEPPASRTHGPAVARGALVDAGSHPEWRSFLLHAAIRRADELERLRDLPDTRSVRRSRRLTSPKRRSNCPNPLPECPLLQRRPKLRLLKRPLYRRLSLKRRRRKCRLKRRSRWLHCPARAIPSVTSQTGSIDTASDAPAAIDPVTAAIELPVVNVPTALPAVLPPSVMPPQRARPQIVTRSKPVRRIRRVVRPAAPKPAPPAPPTQNIFELLFGPLQGPAQPTVQAPATSGASIATPR